MDLKFDPLGSTRFNIVSRVSDTFFDAGPIPIPGEFGKRTAGGLAMFTGRNGRQPTALTLSRIKPKVYQAFAGLAVLLDIYARNTSLNRIHDLRMQGVRELTMFSE